MLLLTKCLGLESKHGYPDAQPLPPTLLDIFQKRLSKFSTITIA